MTIIVTDEVEKATRIAADALEQAINSTGGNGKECIEVAEMLMVLSTAFIRGLCGDEYARALLEAGIRSLDSPSGVHVIKIGEPGDTKH